ncbi:MAG: methyltransferase domain-containing protein [Chloroflexi bacterium]|nr:methyltransferase domain-containing protein [Chloroflexota bacterium]
MSISQSHTPEVMNYEGSGYKKDFWEGKGRDYEDRVERIAIQRLIPPTGKRLLELGAGFGRLTDLYDGYEQVILLDYSHSLLQDAQARLGKGERYIYVAANLYQLPIADGVCDAATLIRVIHHISDVPAVLKQIRSALTPNAVFVLEFANKRNFKAILRYLLRRQSWNPFSSEPIEFVKLNFDFHPHFMADALGGAGFATKRRLAVSYFRLGILKRFVPTSVLVALDKWLQPTGGVMAYSPSVFTKNVAVGSSPVRNFDGPLFKCPACGSTALMKQEDRLTCGGCGAQWAVRDGIYDFREPLK